MSVILCLILLSPALANETSDAVDNLFSKWDKPDSPGCALALIKDGEIIYKRGYGVANLELSVQSLPRRFSISGLSPSNSWPSVLLFCQSRESCL